MQCMSVCGTVHCLNQYNITKTKFNFIEHNKRRKTDQMYIFDLQHNPVDKFTPRENNRMFLPLCLIGEQKAKTEMQKLQLFLLTARNLCYIYCTRNCKVSGYSNTLFPPTEKTVK